MIKKLSSEEINKLAFPAILAGIAEPIISIVDTAFVGRIGTTELAAVGIAGGFYLMMVWILSQTLTAISAIVSRKYGEGSLNEIKTLVPQAIFSNLLLGGAVYILTNFFTSTIFELYNATGDVLESATAYYSIRSIGFPFSMATMLLFGVFRGLQNTSWAMKIAITGASLNIILDYLLIFGIDNTIEEMGLEGAALASLISQMLMFVLATLTLIYKTPFNLKFRGKFNKYFKELMGMSLDLFLRTILLNFTFYLATRYATGYGKAIVAAHTIALNIWLFSSFFIDGFAHAGNALSGKYLGEQNVIALKELGRKISKISVLIGTALALIYGLFYNSLAPLFTTDETVITAFNSIFWLVILSQPINALAFALDGIYKGLGETKILRNILAISTLFVFVPVSVGFHHFNPSLTGIWIAFLAWMAMRSGYLFCHFKKKLII